MCQVWPDFDGMPRLANAGNIKVSRRAHVAVGSMVLKPVDEDVLMAGNPAKVIGKLVDESHQEIAS
jgi:serine acetyltransferase